MLMNNELEEGREKEVILGLKNLAANAEIGEVPGWEHPYLWMLDPDDVCKEIKLWLSRSEI